MRKTLMTLMTAVTLMGCGDIVVTNGPATTHGLYVVRSIEAIRIADERACEYNLSTGEDYVWYMDDIGIIEAPGKFAVGDTVILTASKPAKPIEETVMGIIRELTK